MTSDPTSLTPVGVIGAFPMAVRKELVTELEPLVTTSRAIRGTGPARPRLGFGPGSTGNYGSRWNPRKDLTFVPLRPERVVEVRYEHIEGHRFRHIAQFVRWRPTAIRNRAAIEQLDQPVRFDLGEILDGRVDVD